MAPTPTIDPEMLETVKDFVQLLTKNPALIFTEELKFLREYLSAVGAKLPKMPEPQGAGAGDFFAKQEERKKAEPKMSSNEEMEVEDQEEDEPCPELPQEGILGADEPDPNQDMGSGTEASDEGLEKSNELKSEAIALYNQYLPGEGKFQECIDKYTEAIKLNGTSAVLFAKRGQAYLRLEKPNACIKDCTKALELNPDSAAAYKFRGRAHRLLGHWEEAAADLRQACKIDFDEQADEWLKEVQPHARKIEEWKIHKKLRDEEREIKQRKARAQAAQKARAEAAKAKAETGSDEDATGFADFLGAMDDPEITSLLNDPEVAEAFKEIGQNPANIMKYQNNPKVMKLLQIFQGKLGGMGGMPGMGGMGGMPGMGGMGGMPGMGRMPGGMGAGMGGMPDFSSFGSAAEAPPKFNTKPPGDDLD